LPVDFVIRIFSRILVIPFKETTLHQSLVERMRIKEDLEAKMEESIRNSAVILLFSLHI